MIELSSNVSAEIAATQALIFTAVLAGLGLSARRLMGKPMMSAALAYWVAWTAVLAMTLITEWNDWLHYHFTPYSRDMIIRLHCGAFFGFAVAMFVVPQERIGRRRLASLQWSADVIHKSISGKSLVLLFLIGLAVFMNRISKAGWDLTALRSVYVLREISLIDKIGSHLFVVCTVVVCSQAIRDAAGQFSAWRLAILIGASAPISLAQGGRTFLMAFLLYYGATFALIRGLMKGTAPIISRKETFQIGGMLATLLLLFSIMGFARGGYGRELNIARTVIVWPVSSMCALDSWSRYSAKVEPTGGTLFFDMPIKWAETLGYTRESRTGYEQMSGALRYFRRKSNNAEHIPPTIVPTLIMDFGVTGLAIASGCLAFVMELVVSFLAGRNWAAHLAAAYTLVGAFTTIQNNAFQASFYASLFWICLFGFIASYSPQQRQVRVARRC